MRWGFAPSATLTGDDELRDPLGQRIRQVKCGRTGIPTRLRHGSSAALEEMAGEGPRSDLDPSGPGDALQRHPGCSRSWSGAGRGRRCAERLPGGRRWWKWLRTYSGCRGCPPSRWKTNPPPGSLGVWGWVAGLAGLWAGQGELVVVDRRERPADVDGMGLEADVVPIRAEGFAFAEAGADEELGQVGEVRIVRMAVAQEADRLGRGSDGALA